MTATDNLSCMKQGTGFMEFDSVKLFSEKKKMNSGKKKAIGVVVFVGKVVTLLT